MVADVMGIPAVVGDDDYGDYGDEQAFRKEGEATYDFMWSLKLLKSPRKLIYLLNHQTHSLEYFDTLSKNLH